MREPELSSVSCARGGFWLGHVKQGFLVVPATVGVSCLAALAGPTVLKDHVSDATVWADDAGGLLDHFLAPDPGWSGAIGIAIIGDGRRLNTVGVIWAQASVLGVPNAGEIHELRWRFRFFPDTADFSLAPMYAPAPHPNWEAVFEAPAATPARSA